MANLTPDQMKLGIKRIEKCINEIQEFDIKIIQNHGGSEVKALQASIEGTLVSVFRHDTVEYNRYSDAIILERGSIVRKSAGTWGRARGGAPTSHDEALEAQQNVNKGKERSIQLLRTAVAWLKDELENVVDDSPSTESHQADDISNHPQIQKMCGELFVSGAYAEAVEKSFKVVRDKLRELTGYETGSEAFGKGSLHIQGAAAPNVDSDFNNGAKFLMMAIDMFRNEKSHTSNAKITDPVKAKEYLMLSSLAMHLLDNAEIRH
jgi:uncharacterized protein (TIGR02391 family)